MTSLDQKIQGLRASETLVCLPEPTTNFRVLFNGDLPTVQGTNTQVDIAILYGDSVLFSGSCTLAVQGQTSAYTTKKNLKISAITNAGGNSVDLKISDWVQTSKIDLKAFGAFPAYGSTYYSGIVLDRTMIRDTLSYRTWAAIRKSGGWPDNLIAPLPAWILANSSAESLPVNAKFGTDGYLCSVYVNGDFHGVFVWRGSKPAADYLIDKKNKLHYLVQAAGKNPATWLGYTASDWDYSYPKKPKETGLERLVSYIADCQSGKASLADFESYANKQSWLDYLLFIELAASQDSMINNLFLESWDGGNIWHIMAYDMDETFGIVWGHTPAQVQPDVLGWITNYNTAWTMLREYFADDLATRWKYLRDNNVISSDTLDKTIRKLTGTISTDDFTADVTAWGTNSQSTYGFLITWIQGRIAWLDEQWGYSAS
ncbi:CotH kinase family protein [Acetobacter thailandicus]|uniref:CotH kinase family protein n=1 Tax=Acetobacter thailandicus TaxID=1502842 RepID=UPI001BA51EA3|nr:CotH kinase family protein [Acetobacter thailandicus]MBS0959846.1 CotH kinase family protein [Acetobacter thailandicus]